MAGTLTISTLSDGTNSTSATNLTKAPCVAWAKLTGTGSTPTINASYNISSITRNGTGDYSVAFTNALTDANYSVTGAASASYANGYCSLFFSPFSNQTNPYQQAPTSSGFRFVTQWSGVSTSNYQDPYMASFAVFR